MDIYVKDFVRPGEGDAAHGIMAALQAAKEKGADRVVFEPGTYYMKSVVYTDTGDNEWDNGALQLKEKDVHILVEDFEDITLQGALSPEGEIQTVLVGHNDMKKHSLLPPILWCKNNKRLKVENFKVCRDRNFASSGTVVAKTADYVDVKVFEGEECYDGMPAFCMNRFIDGKLTGESVNYGFGSSVDFELVGENLLRMRDPDIVSKVEVGQDLSWHQGARTDFQCYFGYSDSFTLKNFWTSNSNGFAMIADNCGDILAENVTFKPDGKRFFTGPRDAWKLLKCRGNVTVANMYCEGVRMDGQNMHSTWMLLKEKTDEKTGIFYSKYTYAPLQNGTVMEFYNKEEIETAVITDWEFMEHKDDGNYYRVRFDRPIPEYMQQDSFAAAQCWEVKSYTCTDSHFKNIAGAGHLIRYDNIHIKNCNYENMMNPGIMLGAELPTHYEGGHCVGALIEDCEFDNCGFFPRYDTVGGIGVNSAGFSGPYNKDITIKNCIFKNSDVGIHLTNCQNVTTQGCRFENVKESYRIDKNTTKNLKLDKA